MKTNTIECRVHQIITNKNDAKYPSLEQAHLYFTTNEEIKEGDWVLLQVCEPKPIRWYVGEQVIGTKKIVATTNPDVWLSKVTSSSTGPVYGIPKIPLSFVEVYVREQGIDKVLLEVEDVINLNDFFGVTNQTQKLRLKLKSDGSVIVFPFKEKMYTREELERILWSGCEQAKINQELGKPFVSKDWLDKNYPK